jgi:hypothetical protein
MRSMRPSLNRSAINSERPLGDFGERAAQEVLAGHRYGDDLERALDATCDPRRACDVVDENQPSPGPQHAGHLVQCPIDVGYRAQPERAHDGVEGGVVEWQRVRVTLLEHDRASEITCAVPGNLEHLVTEIDPRETDVRRVRAEIESGADRDLENVPAGL